MLKMMAAPELLNHYHSLPGHFSVLRVHAHTQKPPECIHERAASLLVLGGSGIDDGAHVWTA